MLTLAESQLALAALASLCAGEREALAILRRLVRRVRPAPAAGRVLERTSASRSGWHPGDRPTRFRYCRRSSG
jgi:hypothetical protein